MNGAGRAGALQTPARPRLSAVRISGKMKGIRDLGVMIAGAYSAEDPGPDTVEGGEFRRSKTTIRNWITRDGSSGFPAEAGRFHLYAAWNCPWAHRALLMRVEKGLETAIGVSYARHPAHAGGLGLRRGRGPMPIL